MIIRVIRAIEHGKIWHDKPAETGGLWGGGGGGGGDVLVIKNVLP